MLRRDMTAAEKEAIVREWAPRYRSLSRPVREEIRAYLSTRPGLAALYPSVPAGGKEPGGRACTRSLRQ